MLLAVVEPPKEVTAPAKIILGWAVFIIGILCVGRLMFLGAKWGYCRLSSETFDNTAKEIVIVVIAGIICSSAGAWVLFIDTGQTAGVVYLDR